MHMDGDIATAENETRGDACMNDERGQGRGSVLRGPARDTKPKLTPAFGEVEQRVTWLLRSTITWRPCVKLQKHTCMVSFCFISGNIFTDVSVPRRGWVRRAVPVASCDSCALTSHLGSWCAAPAARRARGASARRPRGVCGPCRWPSRMGGGAEPSDHTQPMPRHRYDYTPETAKPRRDPSDV